MLLGCMLLGLMLVAPAMARDYDLVINNGRIMDPETMCDAVAKVGVKEKSIAAMTKHRITGK